MNFSVYYLQVVLVCLVPLGRVLSDQPMHILPRVELVALKTVRERGFLKTELTD